MSKAQRIILPTLIGVLIGIVSMSLSPVYNIYRLQLNHDENHLNEKQDIWFEDRVFILPNKLMARSYSSYNEKHLTGPVPEGLITEVKVYLPSDQNEDLAYEGVEQQTINTTTKILNIRKQGEVREWMILMSWSIFGFFIGLVLNYIYFMFGRKSKNDEQENT